MANTSSDDLQRLFRRIRTRLLFNHPFLSVLALSLPTIYAPNPYSAFSTNGQRIRIDADRCSHYSEAEITWLYAHTLLHVVLKHPARGAQRDRYVWNKACDLVINLILADFAEVGCCPQDQILDTDLHGHSAEELYAILLRERDQQPESKITHSADKQGPKLPEETSEPQRDLEDSPEAGGDGQGTNAIDDIVLRALTIARKSSGHHAGLNIEISALLKPEIDLAAILKTYLVTSLFERDLSFDRPNRRYIAAGLYLPGLRPRCERVELSIALDSSSSVTLAEYRHFLGIVREVCAGFHEYAITIIPFDRAVRTDAIVQIDHLSPVDDETLRIPKSDGGTNFDSVLHYLEAQQVRPDHLLLVLSDGEFEIRRNLLCETLFLISQTRNLSRFEPYGRVIPFEIQR